MVLIGIGKLLSEGLLKVPPYQRDYAWEREHVQELLRDLSEAISERAIEYFLGTVVISESENGVGEVTDGQQRLATTVIILAAIRDYLIAQEDDERAGEIENTYLFKKDLRSLEKFPLLTLNLRDKAYFEAHIIERRSAEPPISRPASKSKKRNAASVPLSNQRLAAAREEVATFVEQLVNIHGKNPIDHLMDWVDFIEKKAKVIWVRVPDSANAFTIFETLNDRGLELAISDLLKNFLFAKAVPDRLESVQADWISMTSVLEAASSEENTVVGFIRHYWSSYNGLTRERELFREVKRLVTTPKQASELVSNLQRTAVIYAALLNPSHELWRKYGVSAAGHIATLNLLRMTQLRPLLLAVFDSMDAENVRQSLRLLVACAVRVMIVGSRSGTLEETYSNLAKEARGGKIPDAPSLRKAIANVFPSDKEFGEKFAVATVSRDDLARFYLSSLEKIAAGDESQDTIANPNSEEVNLEHVLPENPGGNWGHIPVDDQRGLVKRIGNLALLSAKGNAKAGNCGFTEKKPFYRNSSFELTKRIARFKSWDADAIGKRQMELAELAIKAWSNKFA
ncbi:MAG: DUF262 domain-containing HNH endonuclease family protein [Planctomycetaceae bacterium]|nr:DUF262 domain-containing HNH endonuclease family protein [Planctomycetaceae bacterium]